MNGICAGLFGFSWKIFTINCFNLNLILFFDSVLKIGTEEKTFVIEF